MATLRSSLQLCSIYALSFKLMLEPGSAPDDYKPLCCRLPWTTHQEQAAGRPTGNGSGSTTSVWQTAHLCACGGSLAAPGPQAPWPMVLVHQLLQPALLLLKWLTRSLVHPTMTGHTWASGESFRQCAKYCNELPCGLVHVFIMTEILHMLPFLVPRLKHGQSAAGTHRPTIIMCSVKRTTSIFE